MKNIRFNRFSLRVVLGAMFVFCTLITSMIAISLQYHALNNKEIEYTIKQYTSIANGVSDYVSNIHSLAENAVHGGIHALALNKNEINKELIILLSKLISHDSSIYSIFVAERNNDFHQIINVSSQEVRKKVSAKMNDKWLFVTHKGIGKKRKKVSIYLDENFNTTYIKEEFSSFIPSQRSWYKNAESNHIHVTSPYLFNSVSMDGETFSKRTVDDSLVVGVDVLLSSLESKLKSRYVTNRKKSEAEAFIYNSSGRIIATNIDTEISNYLPEVTPIKLTESQKKEISKLPILKVSNQNDRAPIDYTIGGHPQGLSIDVFKMISNITGLQFKFINGRSRQELIEDFDEGNIDILHSIVDPSKYYDSASLVDYLYDSEYALLTNNHNMDINTLYDEKIGVLKRSNLEGVLKNKYSELNLTVYSSFDLAIEELEKGKIDAILDIKDFLLRKIDDKFINDLKLIPVKKSDLSPRFYYVVSRQNSELFDIINLALSSITDSQWEELYYKWSSDGYSIKDYDYVPYPELVTIIKGDFNDSYVKLHKVNGEERYIYISKLKSRDDVYFSVVIPESYIMSGVRDVTLFAIGGSVLVLFLLIPLAWLMAIPITNPINKLREQVKLVNERRYSDVSRIYSSIEEIHQLGLAVIKGSNSLKNYEQQQKVFFESIIQLIARAIDEKSPYTGGHCKRVPEIALMLAEEAEKSRLGIFKDFRFENESERTEFKVAAWLHDCGKIATPEYVIDKGSKLETNYNRIHEVRMRFEVLWRDAQIKYLSSKLSKVDNLEIELNCQLQSLREEFSFIANANIGSEFMLDSDVERLELLSKKEWIRYFDCGIGLSPLEESRYTERGTPGVETLLSNRPEHIIKREQPYTDVSQFNLKMTVPDYLYNNGELYNLSVRRGTLNQEERFKINEHIISGIKMLESIPFPPELSRVPRYATTHHETLVGTGYPRGLNDTQLSIPERILVVADIFEALTASDRPYKKAKPLSEVISILSKLAESRHIDKDVFDLLVSSGVYKQYANKYMSKEDLDV